MNTIPMEVVTQEVANQYTEELEDGLSVTYVGKNYLVISTDDGCEAYVIQVKFDGITAKADVVESFSRGESSHIDAERLATELDTKLIFQ